MSTSGIEEKAAAAKWSAMIAPPGAGDSLTAGLLHALGQGLSPEEAGAFSRRVVGAHLRGQRLP